MYNKRCLSEFGCEKTTTETSEMLSTAISCATVKNSICSRSGPDNADYYGTSGGGKGDQNTLPIVTEMHVDESGIDVGFRKHL